MAHKEKAKFLEDPQQLYNEITEQFKNVYLPPEEMWWEDEDGLREEMVRYGSRQAPFLCPRALHVISILRNFITVPKNILKLHKKIIETIKITLNKLPKNQS